MAISEIYPDTIIFDPVQSGFYDQEASATYQGGRLMNYLPHIDGLFMKASGLQSSSTNLVLTRNGKGDWSLNRTAAGAETFNVRVALADLLRTGETYHYAEFHSQPPLAGPKGIKILDMFAVMNVGVVSLTSATLRLGSDQYPLPGAAAAAVVVTDVMAATALTTLTAQAANAYLTQKVAITTPAFQTSDLALMEIELVFVMANTGTVQLAGLGAHVAFNYT